MPRQASALTSQQRKVLVCLAAGCPNKEIAGKLGISHSTAKKHLASLRRHYGATSRVEIVIAALKAADITLAGRS